MSNSTFDRFRQTRAARIVAVYSATAWAIFEIIDKTVRTFGWPEVIPRSALILLIVGLVMVTFAAWAYAGQEVGERTGWRWPGRVQALLANRWFSRVAIAGLGVALLLWGWRMIRPDVRYAPFSVPELRASSLPPRLAVLPVTSREAGLELPRRTLTRLLSVDLNDVADMRTVRSELIAERWTEKSRAEPRKIAGFGRENDVHFVVVTEVERGGEGLRASAEILEAGRGESIGHVVVEGRAGDLPRLSDRLAMEIYRTLVADDANESVTSPRRARTASIHAYKAYLRAEDAFRRADFSTALGWYARATEADTTFAMAMFRQGLARRWEDPSVGPPIQSFDRAMAYGNNLAEDDRELLRASGALEWGILEGISAMSIVLERRRDDPQAWYLLADAEVYRGEALLLTPDSANSTVARAARIDPGFGPIQLLRVPIALMQGANRAAVDAIVDSLAAARAHPPIVAEERMLVELAFGDPSAVTGLKDVPIHRLWRFVDALSAPRFLDRQAIVLEEIRRHADQVDPRPAKRVLYYNLMARGLHAEALAMLDDPGMLAFLPEASYRTRQWGIGLPAALVVGATNVYDEYGSAPTWFYGGALAADEGRWRDVEYAFNLLLGDSNRLGQEGDGYISRELSMVAGLLDQYARVRDNPMTERVVELEARRLIGAGSSEFASKADLTARWWLGELWLEFGDREKAARYFRSMWRDPMAAEKLRQIAEGTGSRESVARR